MRPRAQAQLIPEQAGGKAGRVQNISADQDQPLQYICLASELCALEEVRPATVSTALKDISKIIKKQRVILRGPFKVINHVLPGKPPPEGISQKGTIQKWYNQIEYFSDLFQIEEGPDKQLKIQEPIGSANEKNLIMKTPSPIKEAQNTKVI